MMKKLFTLLLILLMICGCTNAKGEAAADNGREVSEEALAALTIVTPKGAPVLAFYDQIANENYTRVTADAISALWSGESSPDVMVCDISSGINAIRNGADYALAAVITFGNFYLGATGNDDNGTMDGDDVIVLFGNENMLPAKVWHYLYGDVYDDQLLMVADAQQAAAVLTSGTLADGSEADYVFLAQPALFGALKQNEQASIYADIQQLYKEKSGNDMIQAAVFIRNDVDHDVAEAFLTNLQASIEAGIADPESVAAGLAVYEGDEATAQYGFNPTVTVNVFKQQNAAGINGMGLGFARAITIKDAIDAFVELFGMEGTGEEIYFQ